MELLDYLLPGWCPGIYPLSIITSKILKTECSALLGHYREAQFVAGDILWLESTSADTACERPQPLLG